jgi:hypothetical protein
MPIFSRAQRLKIALGGFVSFTGLMIVLFVILTASGAGNPVSAFQNEIVIAFVAGIGILDVVCGLILLLRDKKIGLSFASNKKQPQEDVDDSSNTPQT